MQTRFYPNQTCHPFHWLSKLSALQYLPTFHNFDLIYLLFLNIYEIFVKTRLQITINDQFFCKVALLTKSKILEVDTVKIKKQTVINFLISYKKLPTSLSNKTYKTKSRIARL